MDNNNNYENDCTPEQVPQEPVQEQQPEQAPQQADIWGSYQAPVDNTAENYQPYNGFYHQDGAYAPPQPPKKKKGKKILLWGGIAAAVIAVAVALFLILSNTYKTPINILEKQANLKKASSPFEQYAKSLNGFCEEEYRDLIKIMKKSDEYEDLLEDQMDNLEEQIENKMDEYGDDYKVTYEIVDKEELDRDELREFRDELREAGEQMIEQFGDLDSEDYEEGAEALGLTRSQVKEYVKIMKNIGKKLKSAKVTDGYTLTVVVTITGSELDEPEEQEQEINVYKIDGRWVTPSALFVLGPIY